MLIIVNKDHSAPLMTDVLWLLALHQAQQATLEGIDRARIGLAGLDIVGIPLTLPLGDPTSTDPEHPENMAQIIDVASAEALDPRKERRQRVRDYLAELLQSQGIRG